MIAHSLAGKVALVTRVSRKAGIGAAIAQAFAEAGVDVCTTYYRPYDELASSEAQWVTGQVIRSRGGL